MLLTPLFYALLILPFATSQSTNPVSGNSNGAPIVDLGYVKYLGMKNETADVTYYRGIPYARPPVDELRWQKPQPIEAYNNFAGQVMNATQIAPACYQFTPPWLQSSPSAMHWNYVSEDCLILDVYVPTRPTSDSLPVLIQIHGGVYNKGSAQLSPGDALVHAANGSLIYVSIQYRLGILGFLGGSKIAEDGVLNAGLLDQRAALEWVQRNIGAFGGDRAQVTITGGSAGGGSVSYQLLAGGGHGTPPFSAAVSEYPWWQPLLNSASQDMQYLSALDVAGCSDLSCLRSLSADTLATVGQQSLNDSYPGPDYGYGLFWYGPVVDGEFVQELPDQAFKRGHFYDVPVLITHDQYEGVIFTNVTAASLAEETADAQHLFPSGGPSFFSRLYDLYPRSAYNSTFFQRQTWFGDFIINCPTYQIATAYSDSPTASNNTAVFKLIFAAGSELHGADSAFLYSNTTSHPGANNETIAEILSDYLISFVVTHDPNPMRNKKAPFWPSYSAASDGTNGAFNDLTTMGFNVLDVTYTTIGPTRDPDVGPKCDFLLSQGYVLRN